MIYDLPARKQLKAQFRFIRTDRLLWKDDKEGKLSAFSVFELIGLVDVLDPGLRQIRYDPKLQISVGLVNQLCIVEVAHGMVGMAHLIERSAGAKYGSFYT